MLKESVPVEAGEVVDATFMNTAALQSFLRDQIARAKDEDVLFSLHLKATMMKVSDPIIFGHAVQAFFPNAVRRAGRGAARGRARPQQRPRQHPVRRREARRRAGHRRSLDAVEQGLADGPELAMVDDRKGITNLHVPSDVIVDASMPAMIRTSGHMWDPRGEEADTLAVIPDSSYAGIYQVVVDDCREHGAYDPATMGSVSNVGPDGPRRRGVRQPRQDVRDRQRRHRPRASTRTTTVLIEHEVSAGDIWRACQTKDEPIRDWVKLAVTRARATGDPGDLLARRDPRARRQPDREGQRVPPRARHRRARHPIMAPVDAIKVSVDRIRKGENTISVTGNVLRDYLTDLFPILELGTSAKMLSVVPLINGGGLFETGAGGSAPKHVQQLVKENYLRWDSLGEFLALAESFGEVRRGHRQRALQGARRDPRPGDRHVAQREQVARPQARHDRQPRQPLLPRALLGPGAGEADRRQPTWPRPSPGLAQTLAENEETIAEELIAVQGSPADIGGYYRPDARRPPR